MGNVSVTTPCIKDFLTRVIPVSYFGETGFYFGKFNRIYYENTKRLKKQIYLSDDEIFALELGKKIMYAKINNQITVLRRYGKKNIIIVHSRIANYNIYFLMSRASRHRRWLKFFGSKSKDIKKSLKF